MLLIRALLFLEGLFLVMITMQRYKELLKVAQKLTLASEVDPFDILPDALLNKSDPQKKDIVELYYNERRRLRKLVAFTEKGDSKKIDAQISKEKRVKTRICTRCKEELPIAAFDLRQDGSIMSWCSSCAVAYRREWYKAIEARSKKE